MGGEVNLVLNMVQKTCTTLSLHMTDNVVL